MPRTPDLMQMLEGLIETPSVSCVNPSLDMGNRPLIEKLANWLEDLDFTVEIQPLPNQPNKANLIATKGSGSQGLVLAGHTDTVPYDQDDWQQDPFHLIEKNGRLYGLGTCDMKSFLALAAEASKAFSTSELQQPIIILATADEETSMAGARALVQSQQPKARYAIIGEPTNSKPIRMHKGIMMESIRIQGASGHSSNPALGISALEAMHEAIGALLSFRNELQQKYRNPLFEIDVPTLNLGYIHGGDNPNRICGHCELQIDLRPLPGMALAELRALLHKRLEAALKDRAVHLSINPLFSGIPAFETPASSPLVKAVETLTGQKSGAVAFGTEAPYLQSLGMDVLVMGPGDIAQAHQPNEYLAMDRIQPTIALLRQLIRTFCVA